MEVPGAPRIIERPEIVEIAKKLGRTPGQIALRWNLQRGISVLPKTATLSRVTEVSANPFFLLLSMKLSSRSKWGCSRSNFMGKKEYNRADLAICKLASKCKTTLPANQPSLCLSRILT